MSAADAQTPSGPTSDISFVGRRMGKYEIVRVIARGGMGTVYEAINTHIGKRVAMKFVDAELARNKDSVARFQREAEAASAVESGHIVTIFDSGSTDDGLPFLVMELCRGEDLGHRLRKVGRLELEPALDITAQILRGLTRAHEAGIVHRDLKPDNIFLTEQDDGSTFVKILDFGISKMRRGAGVIDKTITKQGTVLGTPFYMSPEQAQALPDVDERTDLWSTGAILYEALTGKPPHDGHSYEQVIVQICSKDTLDARVHNPGIPDKLAEFLVKALKRDRDVRFQNAREMLEALGEASEGLLSPRALRVSSGRQTPHDRPGSRSASNPDVNSGESRLDVATAPTVDVSTGQPSRVGWSTSSGAVVIPDRRRLALGIGVVAAAALAAVFIALRPSNHPAPQEATVPVVTPTQEPTKVSAAETNPVAEKPAADAPPSPAPPEAGATSTERKNDSAKSAGNKSSKSAPSTPDKPAATASAKTSAAPVATTGSKPTGTTPGVAPQLKLKEE